MRFGDLTETRWRSISWSPCRIARNKTTIDDYYHISLNNTRMGFNCVRCSQRLCKLIRPA